jgi:hypothetical protein
VKPVPASHFHPSFPAAVNGSVCSCLVFHYCICFGILSSGIVSIRNFHLFPRFITFCIIDFVQDTFLISLYLRWNSCRRTLNSWKILLQKKPWTMDQGVDRPSSVLHIAQEVSISLRIKSNRQMFPKYLTFKKTCFYQRKIDITVFTKCHQ